MEARTSHDAERPGAVLGNYRLIEPLGEGGFGTVWRARKTAPVERDGALKVIKLGMDTRQVVARFEAERQTLASMDHPGIARVYDAGATPEGRPYFAMEVVDGSPITGYCNGQRMPLRERLELFRAVCLAVQHAHQKGIIHRDLKPSNVLVAQHDGAPLPKVIDFGIAKATERSLSEGTLLTEENQIIGTPEYMAPEQADPAIGDVDTRADVYALGVILYELVTGTRPFDLKTVLEGGYEALLRHIREIDPPKPSTRVSGSTAEVTERVRETPRRLGRALRGDLDWIVMRALEKERDRRYESPGALADDVANHLADRPVEAGPPDAVYRLRKFARRNKTLVAVSSLVAAGLVATFGALAWGIVNVRAQRDAAQMARDDEAVARRNAERAQEREAEARERVDAALLAEAAARGRADEALAREEVERARAEDALAAANEVVAFLAESLAAVRPGSMGREVSMRQVLDAAADKLGGRLSERPLVEARLRATIGYSYLALGALPQAESHMVRAAALYGEHLGDADLQTIETRRELAMLYWTTGRMDEAQPLLEELIAAVEVVHGPDHPELEDLRNHLGVVYLETERYAEAEDIWTAQIEAERRKGVESETLLSALMNLALVQQHQSRFDEAQVTHEEALELIGRRHGPESPEMLRALNNYGIFLYSRGSYDEALPVSEDLLEVRRRVLGELHHETLGSMHNLGLLYQELGRMDDAEEVLLEALEGKREVFGEENGDLVITMSTLAVVCWEVGRLAEAEAYARDGYELGVRTLGPTAAFTLTCRQNLGMILEEQGSSDEAAAIYREVIGLRDEAVGPDDVNTMIARQNLGNLLGRQGRFEEAEEILVGLDAQRERVLGPDHPHVVNGKNALSELYRSTGRLREAADLAREVVAARTELLGEAHVLTLDALVSLVDVLTELGVLEEERDLAGNVDTLARRAAADPACTADLQEILARWFVEVAPEDLRDPSLGVELATRACERTDDANAVFLQTKALALHRAGEREEALAVQRAAVAFRPEGSRLREEAEERLRALEQGELP